MNNIIGNTPYRNIQNKQYIDSSAEYISKLAERLQNENIPFSGRISEYKSTITVSGEDNLKKARKILNDIISENPRRYIGNTQYKYIRDKHIIPVEADIIDKIADRLNAEHIMYSGIVEGDKGRLTVSGAGIEALVKGYIEQEKNSTAAITYEISLTSDAFEDIYYICDENGNAYYDKDGAIPTFNHVDEAEKYSKANNIPLTNDIELLNHWREIEHIDKIRHDNSELVSMFKVNGGNYPDHFTYNASGNSFEWLYYNPDGNFGEGEFIRKTIYEQDIVAAYNARISAADENSGRNEFIYSLFSSCEEIVISSDTEEFTTVANEYINKSETTLELYGIAENSSNIAAVDRLISALEEKCPAVRSAEESRNNAVINEQSDNIDINGHIGTWYVIDSAVIDGKSLYLLESEIYGDEAACLIVDENKNIIMSDVWNGFDDYQAQVANKSKTAQVEINSPMGNSAPETELSLSEQLYSLAKKELETFENSLDTVEKAKASAYELSVKRDIFSYIENYLSDDITDGDVQAAVKNLIRSGSPLALYYDEWLKNEYDNRMEAIRMTAADVHRIEAEKNQENILDLAHNSYTFSVVTFDNETSFVIPYHADKDYVYDSSELMDYAAEQNKDKNSISVDTAFYIIGNAETEADSPDDEQIKYINEHFNEIIGKAELLESDSFSADISEIERNSERYSEEKNFVFTLAEFEDGSRYIIPGEINDNNIKDTEAWKDVKSNNFDIDRIEDLDEDIRVTYTVYQTDNGEAVLPKATDNIDEILSNATMISSDDSSVRPWADVDDVLYGLKHIWKERHTNNQNISDGFDNSNFLFPKELMRIAHDSEGKDYYNLDDAILQIKLTAAEWLDPVDAVVEMNRKGVNIDDIEMLNVRYVSSDGTVGAKDLTPEQYIVYHNHTEERTTAFLSAVESAENRTKIPEGMMNIIFDDMPSFVKSSVAWDELMEYDGINERFNKGEDPVEVVKPYLANQGIFSWDAKALEDGYFSWSAKDKGETAEISVSVNDNITYREKYKAIFEVSWTDLADAFKKRIEQEKNYNKLYDKTISVASIGDDKYRFIDKDENVDVIKNRSELEAYFKELFNKEELNGIIKQLIDSAPFEEYTAPENQLPDGMAVSDNAIVREKNIEAVQNIKVGDEITFNEKTYVITSITDDFMMSMKPKDVSGEQLALSDKSYIGNWKQQLVEEAGENPITIFNPDVSIAIENNSASIHAAFEELNKNHEFSPVALQFLSRAEKIMNVNNFTNIDDVFSSVAIQNNFGSRERIDVALFDGKLSAIADELNRYISADTPSKIALITVHQYDSQYTKAIENFSLSDAIKQMDPVDYKSFYGMGEQISISRAAEIEQGNDKWAYSIDFDLDYNTARISTPTDDYINIGIDEALSIVNNHNEDDLISGLKKLAEKEEQADSPDYALAHEEQKKRTYEIYQIPSGERYRDIRFTRYEQLELMGQLPDHLNYEKVYSGNLDDIEYNDKLEGIFVKFNNNRPEDFKGRSLSVSDVVVIEDENGKSAHFVDDVGFKDITDIFFEHERKEQSVEQLNINDYENIRLVSRSEWDDHTLGDDENPAFEEISVSYTPDEDGSYTKYAYNTTNSSLVDVWDEENRVSSDELLEGISNHLKKMGQDKLNRSYHIVLTDSDGNSRKLDSNNFSFILKDKQRKETEMAASDLEIEKSIEEGIIGSMGYPVDELHKAVEAENSRTDYGYKVAKPDVENDENIEASKYYIDNLLDVNVEPMYYDPETETIHWYSLDPYGDNGNGVFNEYIIDKVFAKEAIVQHIPDEIIGYIDGNCPNQNTAAVNSQEFIKMADEYLKISEIAKSESNDNYIAIDYSSVYDINKIVADFIKNKFELDISIENEAEYLDTESKAVAEPERKKSGNDIEVGDRFLYNDREYTVTSDKGIYPDDVGVSYEEKVGNTSYLTTQNVDRYKLADNGIFLGNSEKQIENSPMGNYDEELKKAAEYLRAYNEREFAISPDNEPFTKDSLSHIGLGYTEIGDNADYSFEVEADLEKYEVRYFIDEKLVKTDKYNSLQEMNEQELSNLEFDYFVSEGNEMLDKMLEAGELVLTDIKEEAPLRKISNENNSYMIVDDVRHAIDELFSGTASDGRKSGGYDWKNYHTAFKSVLDANVQSDIALPLYKSDAEKILLAAQSENTDTITNKEYENALSCLDMVLKNGHLLENPKEQEAEQFSFFSTKSHYVSMDEIKPSFSKHKEPETEKDVVSKTDKSDITAVNSDYTITENNYGDFGGDKTRCQNNIAAIRLLKQIESEKRNASPDEQQILAKYIGWGGLANAFDSSKAEWHKEYSELKELLSPDEYASARASTLNAHYTSYTVINAIYSTLDNMGFKGGKILEPAMGTGNFFGSMPEEMRKNSSLSGVELDSITGRIAKLLYPSANIQIKGYERTSYENNSFDVAVSNVPFGSYKVNDKDYNKQNMLIHDYFFAKTLDKVRPGGIVAFVTSKGTLDKESPEVRKYLAERAELLGAIRLPNTAFKQNAGTEVTSDIIFLQKREKPVSVEQNTPEWVFKDMLPNGIAVNKYFADHPEMILGEMVEGNKLYGNQANATMCVPIEGANLKEQLASAIQNIKGEYREAPKTAEKEEKASVVSCPPEAQKFSYIVQNDTLYYHGSNDTMDIVDNPQTERIKTMTLLRDSVHNLLELQINNYNGNKEIEIANAQKSLSEQYDNFVEKYGRIGQAENKKAFANDNSYHLLKSLEKMDNNGNFIGKADIFSKKTINPQVIIDHCNNAQDALILSLSEKMRVDMDYMSILTGKSESELIAELGDKIYQNPQKNMRWESADEYLTGNIRTKLAAAEEAGLERNAEALRAVMPQRIEAADISVKLGSAWIDPEYIRQFILETIKPDFQTRNSIEVIYSEATDKWKIEGYQHSYGNTLATETYGTSDMNAYEIIEASLNMKKAEIRERVKDEKGVEIRDEKGHYVLAVNQEKTMVVQAKQDELKRKFQDWIFAEPGRRETLTNLYNEKFNSVRLREYDGSHLNFVGMNSDIALKPHQKNAVARSLYSNGNTLLAHEVGAGKTFEMVAIAMEGKRLGLHSKSLVTAPNALTEQWGEAFRTLYPNANVLVATEKDFKPENRRDLFAKIATGDWDAVIIGHSQFDMIHLSRDRELDVLYSEVDKLEAALEEMSANSMGKRSYSVKQVERAIKSYTDKIEKLLEKTPKDDMLCFEQLGIDKIFVDESQAYKNLDTPTKMQNVSGIGSGGSGRSMQLLMKCRYLDEVTGGKGVVFASGTPISNSMSEMYTLMRYLQADKLKELGINSFDRWASIFGETTTSMELSPEANGKYQMKTRFAKFQNLPELMNIFKECADIKTAATLNLDRPDFEMHNINVPATTMQSKMIKELGERAKLIRAGAVEPTEDNMCKLTVDGRKIGLDQRCMDPSLPDDPNSKVNVCINNVFDIWKQTAENKSTQLIFCDLATPQAAVNENTYTLYRKDTEGKYAPIYSGKLGQKDTADKIFKKLTGKKPPKNFEAGGVFDEDIIMLHTVDYDSMTANNSAVIASNGKISEIPAEMWTELHHSPTETFESERKFCVYDDIKQKLVAKGIPEKEIAFIHDADTTEEKQKLFAKMNKGELRVLIGSTQKCGAGMNAQERMIALHDLDAPMRPSDMEQRHGRIIRQGNTNSKVDIYRYTTDKTFDAYLYQMLENKQKFISQIMTDKSPVRSCEDVDEIALDYAEVKALCAGNPLIKEKIDLETEITKLNVLKSSFLSQKYAVQDKAYTTLPREKAAKEHYIGKLKKDAEFAEKEQPLENEDGKKYYPVTVGDKVYHEKDEAGEAIRQAILKEGDILQGKESHIGYYRGFEMTAFLDAFSKKIKVNLKNETNHYGELNMDSNVKAGGNIIRLDNVINSIGITLMKEEERLQAICADIEESKVAAEAEFPQEQELTLKEKRLAEVNNLLASTEVNTEDRSSELYAALVEICPALKYNDDLYCRYEASEGIEPLTIERKGDVVFIAHTYTQNGDLMYDPAIEFSFDTENQKAEAISYEFSGMGVYKNFSEGNLPEDKADVEIMALETMFENIKVYDYKLVETNIDIDDERGTERGESR